MRHESYNGRAAPYGMKIRRGPPSGRSRHRQRSRSSAASS
jgi:hypothetical protein